MNLRLDEADEAALEALALSYGGISKQQAVIRAVHETAIRRARATSVERISGEVARDWAELLERLKTM